MVFKISIPPSFQRFFPMHHLVHFNSLYQFFTPFLSYHWKVWHLSYVAMFLAVMTDKLACQSLCQLMKSNVMRACKWVDNINTFEVFVTHLFIYWLQEDSCCNCKILMIVSIVINFFCWSKFSFEKWSHIFKLHLFLWIAAIELPKMKPGERVCTST